MYTTWPLVFKFVLSAPPLLLYFVSTSWVETTMFCCFARTADVNDALSVWYWRRVSVLFRSRLWIECPVVCSYLVNASLLGTRTVCSPLLTLVLRSDSANMGLFVMRSVKLDS